MQRCFTCHQAGTHRVGEAPFFSSLCFCLSSFRMFAKAQVIVDAPYNDFFSVEIHSGSNLSFELREHIISFTSGGILTQWSTLLAYSLKYFHSSLCIY